MLYKKKKNNNQNIPCYGAYNNVAFYGSGFSLAGVRVFV